jgi:hypothetical protein
MKDVRDKLTYNSRDLIGKAQTQIYTQIYTGVLLWHLVLVVVPVASCALYE